jgi:prolyl-tRNA editing enzyme YbaK/EbsC (Cys-tRNA(Pro) deacylase)
LSPPEKRFSREVSLNTPLERTRIMSLESVRRFFAEHAPDIVVLETEASSATVPEAAAAHGVATGQIAKTLSLRVAGQIVLVVTGGDARLDNRKFKDRFGGKASMLAPDEVEAVTGHPIGGVCPFGLPTALPIYCDVSLKAYGEVVPAAGSRNSAVRIAPMRMADLVGAEWVDVCKEVAAIES